MKLPSYTECVKAAENLEGFNSEMLGNCCGGGVIPATLIPAQRAKLVALLGQVLKGEYHARRRTAIFCTTTDRAWQKRYTNSLLKFGYKPIASWPSKMNHRDDDTTKMATIYLWQLVAKRN